MILNERKSQEDFSHIGKKHDREGRGKKRWFKYLKFEKLRQWYTMATGKSGREGLIGEEK